MRASARTERRCDSADHTRHRDTCTTVAAKDGSRRVRVLVAEHVLGDDTEVRGRAIKKAGFKKATGRFRAFSVDVAARSAISAPLGIYPLPTEDSADLISEVRNLRLGVNGRRPGWPQRRGERCKAFMT